MGGGACRRCGKDACTTSMRMVAVKYRFPCVDCKLELSTPAVCDYGAFKYAPLRSGCRPRSRSDLSPKGSIACIC